MYANRYQLIVRFAPIEDVLELRLLSRRDPHELAYADPMQGIDGP